MINKSGLFKHKLLTIVSILAIILTIDSCKKEDDVKPIIEVLNTIKNTYSVNDSIHIRAKITDNEALKQLQSLMFLTYPARNIPQIPVILSTTCI